MSHERLLISFRIFRRLSTTAVSPIYFHAVGTGYQCSVTWQSCAKNSKPSLPKVLRGDLLWNIAIYIVYLFHFRRSDCGECQYRQSIGWFRLLATRLRSKLMWTWKEEWPVSHLYFNSTSQSWRYEIKQKLSLDFRIPPHLLAYELNVLFSMSRSLREEGNMQISEGVFWNRSEIIFQLPWLMGKLCWTVTC